MALLVIAGNILILVNSNNSPFLITLVNTITIILFFLLPCIMIYGCCYVGEILVSKCRACGKKVEGQ